MVATGRETPMSEQTAGTGEKTDLALEIAHLLFIDVVGYSKLLVNEEIELMQTLNRIVRGTECFRDAETSERMIRLPTGDGMVLVFFRSPEQPVRCALQISEALQSCPQIQVRMGIHSGPVNQMMDVNDQLNLAGAGINIGQRVMDCGDAGHILLSKHIAEDLAQYRHWQPYLHDLGECEVKHGLRLQVFNLHREGLGNSALPEKFRHRSRGRRAQWTVGLSLAGLLLFAGAIIWHEARKNRPDPVSEKSIAVLRFENRSDEKDNAYFADAIQDEILTRLSKIANLKVISRTSTQHYNSVGENLPQIARQLGVAHILEGSVQRSGDVVRVNVQLIKAATDSHVWAETFDRELKDIFALESEIAKTIADQLRVQLTGEEEQRVAAKPTDNKKAYDAYLRGLAYTLRPGNTTADALGAQKYFREAVRLDPKFALGWALLADTDAVGYLTTGLPPTMALRDEARSAAETALTLQPNLGEAILAQGQYHYACLKDYDNAVRYFERARKFLPNSSRIPESLAYVARRRGEWDLSETYFKEAERLDPRNVKVLTEHAFLYGAQRRFPEAVQKLDQVLDIVPDDLDTLAQQAGIAQAQGDLSRAAALLASLRPTAADTGVLGRQVYQAILERQPGLIIPRLKVILAQPDPASGNFNGELRFWLGWAQHMAGDEAAAVESWRQARTEVESFLKDQPENDLLIGDLALLEMALGNKAAALTLAERAMAVNPIEKDAISGPTSLEILARVAAGVDEPDRALAALEKLLSIPYAGAVAAPLTPSLLRLDSMFDPLRNEPRFQTLVGMPASK